MLCTFEYVYMFVLVQDNQQRIITTYDDEKDLFQPWVLTENDVEMLESMKKEAEKRSKEHNLIIELIRFSNKEVVEVYGSKSRMS